MVAPLQPPDYVLLSEPSREALLSQWGVSNNAQRELFQKLCALRRADIDPTPWNKSDLDGLMMKLRDARVGILLSKNTADGRQAEKILLTDEGSSKFWYYFLSEIYQAGFETNHLPFLKSSSLKTKQWFPPPHILTQVQATQVKRQVLAQAISDEKILSISLSKTEDAICPAKDYQFMVSQCFKMLRISLNHQANQIAVSRYLKTNLNELNKHINAKEAGFWKMLTTTLVANREELSADPRQKWDATAFYSSILLGGMVESQLEEAQRERDDDKEKDSDMKALVQILLKSSEGYLSPEEIHAAFGPLKIKYKEQFNSFSESFKKRYTVAESSTGLPPVVVIDESWFHRDRLYHFFVHHWDRLKVKIKPLMTDRLQHYIQSDNKSKDLAFAQADSFEHALKEEIEKLDPEIGYILKRPRLLAEAAIALKKEVAAAQPLLERFFKQGTMFFKRLSLMLDLDPEELFSTAVHKLSWFSQLLLMITGKRKLFLDQVLSLAPRTKVPVAQQNPSTGKPSLKSLHNESESTGTGVSPRRRPRTQPTPKPKVYNEKETNSAWSDFAQNVKKK